MESQKERLADYDRGWDGGPPKGNFRSIVEKVVRYFDKKNVDWDFEERR